MGIKSKKIVTTIKDQVYEVLKENIVSGELKPGERLQEVQIAEELNVSRSPVRNAINKLIGEGLLESIPNKSVCVRRFSTRDIIESYEFRLIIERFAVEKVASVMDDGIEQELSDFRKSFLEYADIEKINEYLEVDADFHEFLIEVAGNKVIKEALDKVSIMISPFRVLALSSPKRFYDSVDEHIAIIDHLLARNGSSAAASCENHLNGVKDELLRKFRSA